MYFEPIPTSVPQDEGWIPTSRSRSWSSSEGVHGCAQCILEGETHDEGALVVPPLKTQEHARTHSTASPRQELWVEAVDSQTARVNLTVEYFYMLVHHCSTEAGTCGAWNG